LPCCRLVDRELDRPGGVTHDLGAKGGVLSADVFVVEADELGETENVAVEFYPVVHLSFFDVSDDIVYVFQSYWLSFPLESFLAYCLWAAVGNLCHASSVFVIVTYLLRVSDVQLDVIYYFYALRVVLHLGSTNGDYVGPFNVFLGYEMEVTRLAVGLQSGSNL